MEENCHREHGELTESTERNVGIWSESEFRLSALIQALCEFTDPRRISQGKEFVTENTEESQRARSDDISPEPIRLPAQ
jgi:hypothetical protein